MIMRSNPKFPFSQQKYLVKTNKTKKTVFSPLFELYLSVGLYCITRADLLGHNGLIIDASSPKVKFCLFFL